MLIDSKNDWSLSGEQWETLEPTVWNGGRRQHTTVIKEIKCQNMHHDRIIN